MSKKILLCGTTGSGKTTLLRLALGLDLHSKESNFLATSTSKTTTARVDVELMGGPYSAYIELMTEEMARLLISECVEHARHLIEQNKTRQQVANAFVEHEEQRFRLKYLLGNFTVPVDPNEMSDELGITPTQNVNPDVDDLIDRLYSQEDDASIVDRTISLINNKMLLAGLNEWVPNTHVSEVQFNKFASDLKIFTGNHYRYFGELLTPLVTYVRLSGPFVPTGYSRENIPEWTFIDGEGLGHVSTSSGSVPSKLIELYQDVDVILVVDNATQPLQAGTQSLITSAGTMGHTEKIALAFTHFDQVSGDNLDGLQARKEHVSKSVGNFLYTVGKTISPQLSTILSDQLAERTYFFSYINTPDLAHNKLSLGNLSELYKYFEQVEPVPMESRSLASVAPFIHNPNIIESIHTEAVPIFLQKEHGNMRGSHWTQLKALARRFTYGMDHEYAHLRPVSHLTQCIMSSNYQLLVHMCGGNMALVNKLADEMGHAIHRRIRDTLCNDFDSEWTDAYYECGTGCHVRRVGIIDNLFEDAFVENSQTLLLTP